MAISKKRKDELVAQYSELIKQSQAMFLTEYTGLNVKQMQELRGEVRKADGTYHVTKNTLMLHALREAGLPAPEEMLQGQLATGFALNEVPTLAKTLIDYAKKEEQLSIRGAILGDDILNRDQIETLAKLPSKDELRAQIIGLIQAPAQNIAGVLAGGVRQVVNVIDAYAKQEEQAPA